MPSSNDPTQPDLPAGEFSAWLRDTRRALMDDTGSDVPCGDCVACCATSHFVDIGPDEARTLARIPRELLFPASGKPQGTVLMGYDQDGRCPMLSAAGCSIYEDRPRTCRTYDCRVFAAAGIAASREQIAQRARRWAFGYPAQADRAQHAAVQAAARFVREHAASFPGGAAPDDPAQAAVLAVKVSDVFLKRAGVPGADQAAAPGPAAHEAADVVRARELAAAIVAANERYNVAREQRGGTVRLPLFRACFLPLFLAVLLNFPVG